MTNAPLSLQTRALQTDRQHGHRAPTLRALEANLAALTVFLSPMNYFRFDAVYLTLADLAACATLLVMLFRGSVPRAPLGIATPLWFGGVLAIATGLTIGSVVNGDMVSLIAMLLQYFFSLVVFVVIIAGRSYRETVTLLKVLVLSITIVMAFGAFVIHFVPDPDLRLVSYNGRLRSLVERSNEAAALGAIAIVLLLSLTLMGEVRRMTAALFMPILLYGILLTGSNTGVVLTIFGISATVLFSGSAYVMTGFLLASAAAVAATFLAGDVILPEVFKDRVLSALTSGNFGEAGTFEDRFLLIQEAIDIARDTLLVGLGADQYRTVSAYGAPVHNTYLLLLAEGGLIALIGLALLLLAGLTLAGTAISNAGTRRQGFIALTIVLIYAALLLSFAHFYARFWCVPLALAIALPAARLKANSRTT
jgi:O-antigen ligase